MGMEIDIPRDVDSPLQILWWEIDELFAAMIVFGAGLLTHRFFIPMVVALFAANLVAKMKVDSLPGGAPHFAYAHGLTSLNKEFIDYMEKEFYL